LCTPLFLDNIFKLKRKYLCALLLEIQESISYQEAIDLLNHKELMDAMGDEMDSIARNKAWELVDLSPQCKSIGSKLVFMIKCRADGSIDKFKGRLVGMGFT